MAKKHIDLFTQKAQAVSAVVTTAESLDEALTYAVDLCEKKEACQLLVSGCEEPLSRPAEELCETKQQKVLAAPNLMKRDYNKLAKRCEDKDIACLRGGLRDRLAGIDVGLTLCQAGLADTGSLVLNSNSEETRLATMISEVHVALVAASTIMADSFAAEKELAKLIGKQPSYTAFITGASRTADIERVLALGVHGPLELHIVILNDLGKEG